MRVLIADPDWHFAGNASRYFESRADLVLWEPTAEAASRHVQSWHADLVIVSCELAEQGLLDTLQTMPSRPAVLLTDNMDRTDRAWRCWQKIGDELLLKPLLNPAELGQAVLAALTSAAGSTRRACDVLAVGA